MVDEPYSFEDFGKDQAFSVEDMAPPVSDFMGGSAEDYNSFIMGGDSGPIFGRDQTKGFNVTDGALNPGQVYNIARGATATNPYPESFWSNLFGAENVDYTNILGGQGVADINTLRARQGLGLPSLITDKSYKMGDYYIGQPTIQGVVEEVPSSGIMGLLEKVPGVSTLRNLLGRNRGLPSESERFRQAVKEAEENQINLPSFPSLNLSDVGRNLVQNVTASKYNPFTETGPYQEGDFPEGYNLVPEKRVEIADLPQYPMTTTNKINNPQMTDIERYIKQSVRNMPLEIKKSMPDNLTAYFEQQLSPKLPIPTDENRERRDLMRDLLAYQAEQKRLNSPIKSSFFNPGVPKGMTVGDLERMTTRI